MYKLFYESPWGFYKIESSDVGLFSISLSNDIETSNPNSILKLFAKELDLYFDNKLKVFKSPLDLNVSDFFNRVYTSLQKTSYGKTYTYKDIALDINMPKASRAIGMANNRNPLPIIIPCHRINGSNNKLVGYEGGLDLKIAFQALEQNRLNFFKYEMIDKEIFENLKLRCMNFPNYNVSNGGISYIFNNQRINVRWSNNNLYVYFKDLKIEDVKKDLIFRFGLDISKTEMEKYFRDTKFAKLITRYKNYHEIYNYNLFEVLVTSVIFQFISMKAACSITKKLMIKFGKCIDEMHDFPTPSQINNISLKRLKNAGLTTSKAKTIKAIASLFVDHKLTNESFGKYDKNQITKMLLAIKGIGKWTIDNFMLFGMRDLNILPFDDLGLQSGVQKYFKLASRPNKKELESLFKDTKRFGSFLTIYLWKYTSEIDV